MEGRLAMLAFIASIAGVQTLAALPSTAMRWELGCLSVLTLVLRWRVRAAPSGRPTGRPTCAPWLRAVLLCACAGGAGALYAIERAQWRLEDALPADQENQVMRATVRVVSLVESSPDALRFDAEVLASTPVVTPHRLRVSWPLPIHGDAGVPRPVIPGQHWKMALVLKRPHAVQNPHGPDGEARMFHRDMRATATVRGKPQHVLDEGYRLGMVGIHRARHVLRERMRSLLGDTRHGAVVIALALGDQAGVARDDWRVFNATGITHLVSISGLHVTLVAGLAGSAVAWSWRRVRWRGVYLAERTPAALAGIAAALFVAWLYCLLAGWGIPARRTFFMLAVAGGSALLRLPLSRDAVLLFAACVVVAFDPWAPIAPGFWLSFGAVAAVLAWGQAGREGREGHGADLVGPGNPARGAGGRRWHRWLRHCMQAGRLQCVVTLSLMPALAFLTQQVSVASPLANAIAIPAVSLVVTPLALLCAALCALAGVVPGAAGLAAWPGWTAQAMFGLVMRWIDSLAAQGWSVWDVAAPPLILLALAATGIAWALLPPAMASRRWAWLLIVPALCWRPARPAEGEWRLTALDVGQGGAVVVETATHALVFDSGPLHRNGTDGAQRVLWPYLRARGVRRIDTLVISHADDDHAGGLDSLLRAVPVDRVHASFDVARRLRRDARKRGWADEAPLPAISGPCEAGQAWEVDGVRFAFLHPRAPTAARETARPRKARRGRAAGSNADGCVLLVEGRHHRALLPGDVGVAQENGFAPALPPIDVVVAPHHGSKTSSGAALVDAARARHVIAQVGYLNRFQHPAPAVARRWRRAGASFWRTDHHGAVIATSRADALVVRCQRALARRYWHTAMAPDGARRPCDNMVCPAVDPEPPCRPPA
ncbi:DNA internalization-related competence protein ComEC/Rec2 [Bordetella genomosp. 9]|uniref:DNA internalization-related competence protein ComEC/Rec2 n=1 Tax=Bordetella genomosp. 9 TaxID=1416803 RepID=A0A261R2T9_9BORD|nr:DNA internalization-related competence protein ComEC/Rec2 [Bordetella genomosp. 9]OZI19291.1 DNA internalization-related competence protein ComEC/Rec2 [Bordetella genomosp. 9]